MSRRRNRVKRLEERLVTLKREKQKLQKKRARLVKLLQKKEGIYHQEINKETARAQALGDAEKNLDHLEAKVREEALDVLDVMRDPHALSSSFSISMLALKDGLDKVKLPESAAREFFEDLAGKRNVSAVGPIDGDIAHIIRSRASQYLGSEDVSLLNSMKSTIKDSVGEEPEEYEVDLKRAYRELIFRGR